MSDEREPRVIDLPGVITPSEFVQGWEEGQRAYLNEGGRATCPHAFNIEEEFQRGAGWTAGFAYVRYVMVGLSK